MMRRIGPAVGALTAAILLSSCTHSTFTAPLPVIDAVLAAEVAIIRPSGFKGCGVSIPVMLDGREIFTIECGKHVLYPISAGEHVLGINFQNVWGLPRTNVTPMTVVAKERYYLRLDSLSLDGPKVDADYGGGRR